MEKDMLVERTTKAVVESERDVVVMNQPANSHNNGNGQEEQINVAGKQQLDLEGTEMSKIHNLSDENVTRMDAVSYTHLDVYKRQVRRYYATFS